jgi:hypothetical protein
MIASSVAALSTSLGEKKMNFVHSQPLSTTGPLLPQLLTSIDRSTIDTSIDFI